MASSSESGPILTGSEKKPRPEARLLRQERSAELDRHVDLLAFALDQQRDGAVRLVDDAAQLVDALEGLVVEREDDVAGLHAGARRGAFGAFDEQPALGLDLPALLLGQGPHRDPELALLRHASADVGLRHLLARLLAERGGQLLG